MGDAYVWKILVGFGEQYDDVCFFCCLDGAFYTHLLNAVGCFADACSVDEAEGDAFYLYGVLDKIAGGTLNIGNDGAFIVNEGIHEGTFTHVWRTYYGNRDACLKGIASAEGVGKLLDVPVQRIN